MKLRTCPKIPDHLIFSWYIDDMLLTNSESTTYLANTLGSHSYSATVMIDGCVSAQSESVLISVFPQNEVTILPNPATFCIDDSVMLVASNTNGDYAWSPGGESTDAITVYEEGSYHVTSIDNNGCVGEDTIAVEALASPPIPSITNIDNLYLESSALQGNQWFLNGEPIPGATDQQFVPSVNGSYSVIVTLEGCDSPQSANYDWIYISVNSEYQFNDYLKLYPNPTSSICYIEGRLPAACNFRIRITNSLGQVEYENSEYLNSTEFREKISLNVSNGLYHVLVLTDLGTLSAGLLIIKE